jgi:hypothetical protein
MSRQARFSISHVSWALPGVLFLLLGIAPDVQASVTDNFPMSVAGKEWCRGNPKFFETIIDRINPKDNTQNIILQVTRDPGNTGDLTAIQATIDTKGTSTEIDAMTLTGLIFPTNKSGSTAQFVLLGTLVNGHWVSVRGQAIFDRFGNLTKVTGTAWDQITGTYTIDKFGNQSAPTDCFDTVTIVTGKKF